MKKIIFNAALLATYLLFCSLVYADPGVVIEAKGGVTLTQNGKSIPAKTGAQFVDGAVLEASSGASATLMFNNGAVKKLSSGEKFTAVKSSQAQGGSPLVKGLAMAYNDATRASKGPVVHGMVKAAPGQKTAVQDNAKLSPERTKQLEADLKQTETLGLDHDGKTFMQSQVYYKYQQYQKAVNLLLPLYKSQNPPEEMVKNLIIVSFEQMGKNTEAAKFRK